MTPRSAASTLGALSLHQMILFSIIGIVVGGACTLAELIRPARPVSYRRVVLADAVSFVIYMIAFVPIAQYFTAKLAAPYNHHVHLWRRFHALPLALKIAMYYLVADFGTYWLHRALHTRALWRIHRWHHAPRYMYWFAGVRATAQQQLIFNLPYAVIVPVLAGAPGWVFELTIAELIVRNDWMHMNVTWRSNWIEWIFVTPRFHHIHHSPDLAGNYGSLFSIWDRWFGTRIDPDTVAEPLRFGTGEDDHRLRLVAGV